MLWWPVSNDGMFEYIKAFLPLTFWYFKTFIISNHWYGVYVLQNLETANGMHFLVPLLNHASRLHRQLPLMRRPCLLHRQLPLMRRPYLFSLTMYIPKYNL